MLTFALVCAVGSPAVQATPSATVSVGSVSGYKGETISVPVQIENNPGMVAMRIFIEYDDAKLCLISAEDQGLFGVGNAYFGHDVSEVPYPVMWEDGLASENHTGNENLAILTFQILDGARSGDTTISISYDQRSTFDANLNDVSLNTISGTVTIINNGEPEPDETCIVCSEVDAYPGQTINVPIYLYNNPGVVALKISIAYDAERMALKGVTDGGILGTNTAYFGNRLTDIPYTLLWEDGLATTNHRKTGLLVTLTFEVSKTASIGKTNIAVTLEQGSTFNVNLDNVSFETIGGCVTVNQKLPGDVNKDGETNLKDVVLIRRLLAGGWNVKIDEFLADVDDDQTITLADVVLITRYLVGGWGVVLL